MDPTVEHEQLATRISQELQVYLHKGLRDYLPGGRMFAFGCVGALLGLGGSVLLRPTQFTTQPATVTVAEVAQQVVSQPIRHAAFLLPSVPVNGLSRVPALPQDRNDGPASPPAERGVPAQSVAAGPLPIPPRKGHARSGAPGLLVPLSAERRRDVPSHVTSSSPGGLLIPPEFASTLPGNH